MDEKYWKEKLMEIYTGVDQEFGWTEKEIIPILKQIFLDGCEAQAANSVEAMIRFMDKCHKDNPTGMFLIASGKDLIDALAAAEIKEV